MNPPVFVEKPGYRRRRAADAARMVPVLGLMLFLMPLLWGGANPGATLIYVLTVWLLLVILAAVLSRIAGDPDPPNTEESGGAVTGHNHVL